MSYEAKSFCTITCDQPGCDRHLSDEWDYGEIGWYPSMGHADEAAQDNGLQVKGDGIHAKHYCPEHHYAECSDCGCLELGTRDTFEREGWIDPDVEGSAICPDCAKRGEGR